MIDWFACIGFGITLLFFKPFDQNINTLLQFLLIPWHKQMIKSYSCISSYRILYCRPVAIALFISHTQQHDVCFFWEVFGLLSSVDNHFFDRSFVGSHFLSNKQRSLFLKAVQTLSSFKVALYLFKFIQLIHLFVEHVHILLNFINCFSSNMLSDLRDHLFWVHFKRLD